MRPPPKHVINGFDERGSRGGRDGDFCRRLYTYILFVAQELERAREQEETAAKEDMYYVQVSPSAAATPSGSQPPPFNTQQAASVCAASRG